MNNRISVLAFCMLFTIQLHAQTTFSIKWNQQVLINNMPVFKDAGKVKDAVDFSRQQGNYGSQYARMLELSNGTWLAGYTISRNNGYSKTPKGGLLNCKFHPAPIMVCIGKIYPYYLTREETLIIRR